MRGAARALFATLVTICVGGVSGAQEPDEDAHDDLSPATSVLRGLELTDVPTTLDAAAARASIERSLDWLVTEQREDGAWATAVLENVWEAGFSVETYYAWQVASQALAIQALLEAPADLRTEARDAALAKGLEWLVTSRMPKRGSDWDIDYVWSQLLSVVVLTGAAADERFAGTELAAPLVERGRAFYAQLEASQAPDGGWAYYDDPPYTRPSWSTSFCTALVLPALLRARELGWTEDRAVFERALRYVQRCALPEGAYSYSLTPLPRVTGGEHINRIKGSLGRTQVCNWGRATVGDPRVTSDVLREGLEAFFEHHELLDVARMRPVPHEAFYGNAGYFYLFAHYYAALCINLLPPTEREAWHAKLRPHLAKIQYADGSSTDFLATGYLTVAGTAYSALALTAGLGASER